jgi:hypothetical protein
MNTTQILLLIAIILLGALVVLVAKAVLSKKPNEEGSPSYSISDF